MQESIVFWNSFTHLISQEFFNFFFLFLYSHSSDSQRSRHDAFVSPLHIPDEENMNRGPDNLLAPTPESPPPNILGLASGHIDDPLTPT